MHLNPSSTQKDDRYLKRILKLIWNCHIVGIQIRGM